MLALVALVTSACSSDRAEPTLQVSSDLTAAIATAALGDDATVTIQPGGPIVDDALLGELAPMPFGQVPPWTTTPPPNPGGPALGAPDPAVWLDPDRVVQAARTLAARVELDDDARQRTEARIEALHDTMRRADEQVQALVLARTPGLVVGTGNVRLGYFAERYGLQIQPLGDPAAADPLAGLDLDHLGPEGTPTATLDAMLVEVARRVTADTR